MIDIANFKEHIKNFLAKMWIDPTPFIGHDRLKMHDFLMQFSKKI